MDIGQMLQQQLSQQLSNGLIDQLSEQIGAPKKETATASSAILSSLMGALARNASTPDGAASLSNALERDHDGSILDNLGGLMGGLMGQGRGQVQKSGLEQMAEAAGLPPLLARAINGSGILKHVLGNQQEDTMREVSQTSGLSLDKVGPLMTTLAPILMGMLGKTKREAGLDAGGLGGMLTEYMGSRQQQNNPGLGMAGQLLDRDGDGSVIDDIADIGTKMLGGFFSNRR